MDDEEQTALVIDNGSDTIHAGFSGDDAPRACFFSAICRKVGGTNIYVGNEAVHGIKMNPTYPIKDRIVTSWDDVEHIWHHTYKKLHVSPEEHAVLLTDAPMNPRANREKMTAIMFEKFHAPAMYVSVQAVLSLYASGRTTGVVLDSGASVSSAVLFEEGNCFHHATQKESIGGYDVTDILVSKLNNIRTVTKYFDTVSGRAVARDIKERLGRVALDYHDETARFEDLKKEYELPDGRTIMIGNERFLCPEVFFNPTLVGKEVRAVQKLIHDSIMKSDVHIYSKLYQNIVLSGGSTMFPGIQSRLTKELRVLASIQSINKVTVVAMPERKFAVWIGGSILSSLSTFQGMWISQDEYNEVGPTIVYRKCHN